MTRLVVAFIILLIGTSIITAQPCYIRPASRTFYSGYNSYPQYSNYNYNYQYPYNNYYPYIVPKILEVEVHRDHYYSIDPYLQNNLLADAIVGRLLRLQQGNLNQPSNNQPSSIPNNQPTNTQPSNNNKPSRGTGPGNYQNPKLLEIMTKSCVKCHNNTSAFPLVTSDNKILDVSEGLAWKAFGLVNSGEMPKSSPNLDDESVKIFYEWAKALGKK